MRVIEVLGVTFMSLFGFFVMLCCCALAGWCEESVTVNPDILMKNQFFAKDYSISVVPYKLQQLPHGYYVINATGRQISLPKPSIVFQKEEMNIFGALYTTEIISVEFKSYHIEVVTKKIRCSLSNAMYTTSYPLGEAVEIYKTILQLTDSGWIILDKIKGEYTPEQTKVETTPEQYIFPEKE